MSQFDRLLRGEITSAEYVAEMRERQVGERCWCGRLRRDHPNGSVCTRYGRTPPKEATHA